MCKSMWFTHLKGILSLLINKEVAAVWQTHGSGSRTRGNCWGQQKVSNPLFPAFLFTWGFVGAELPGVDRDHRVDIASRDTKIAGNLLLDSPLQTLKV